MSKVKVGDIFKTNEGGSVTVIGYKNNSYITVKHNDEHEHKAVVERKRLFLGTIKNPYHKSVCGVGYLGVGKYKTQKDKVLCKAYKIWRAMLKRCYTKLSTKNINYKDCVVCDEWHNFQKFAEWYYNQMGWDCSYHLDKDLFSMGYKIYSPETCCLIPAEINSSIISITNKESVLGYYKRSNELYEVRCRNVEGSYKSFSNKEDALEYYRQLKFQRIQWIAKKWEGKVDGRVFDKLINWEF